MVCVWFWFFYVIVNCRGKMSGKGSEEHTIFDEKSKLDMPEAEYAGSQNNLVSSTSLVSVPSFGILCGIKIIIK